MKAGNKAYRGRLVSLAKILAKRRQAASISHESYGGGETWRRRINISEMTGNNQRNISGGNSVMWRKWHGETRNSQRKQLSVIEISAMACLVCSWHGSRRKQRRRKYQRNGAMAVMAYGNGGGNNGRRIGISNGVAISIVSIVSKPWQQHSSMPYHIAKA